MKGLWLTRALPYPLDTGDRIYSARLMRAAADAGAELTVAGFAPKPADALPQEGPIRWHVVPGGPHRTWRALASALPLVAAAHATATYRQHVAALARQAWDFVVFDQYGTGWATAAFDRHATAHDRPVLVHVAHDHEASVNRSLARGFQGSLPMRLGLWQNWLKTRRLERRLVRHVDLVTAITAEDQQRFAADAPATASVVLMPGYAGPIGDAAGPGRRWAGVPRNVLIVGNYTWLAKSENLRHFVAAADAAFHAHGITLHVVGSMAEALAEELRRTTKATVLHGFVDDIAPLLANARIAVVPEAIGGGFKLKFLDYIFGRVPVATLAHAAAGLSPELCRALIRRESVPALVQAIVDGIDDSARLDAMQRQAFDAARLGFKWEDRGVALLNAIRSLRTGRAGVAHDASDARGFLPSR